MKGIARVIAPGVLSLVEGRRREGFADLGVTEAGPADRYSAAWANYLAGNPADAPLLEINLGGLKLEFENDAFIALSGAEAPLRLNGREIPGWRGRRVSAGDRLEIGMARRGLRIYLAFAGGLEAPRWLGSPSVSLRDRLGRPLEAGDPLEYPLSGKPLREMGTATPPELIPEVASSVELEYLPGAQADRFGAEELERFRESVYQVGRSSDRMGCRLEGEGLGYPGEILSEAVSEGAIQIPPDGRPIVMLCEHQTIGGYPKLGALIPRAICRLAQAAPGTRVRFIPLDPAEALAKAREFHRFLQRPPLI